MLMINVVTKKQISCRSMADSLYIYAIVLLTHAIRWEFLGWRYYSFLAHKARHGESECSACLFSLAMVVFKS